MTKIESKIESNLEYMLRTKKQVRATIKKEGSHFVVSVGGHGMTIANTKELAKERQSECRKSVENARERKKKGQRF
jgi:hypothetical protein